MGVALGWVVLGVAVAVGGWRMDRLGQMNIEPWSAPGLVPGVLGVLMAAFGAILAWRERRAVAAAPAPDVPAGADATGTLRRVLPILALAIAWVAGTLGRGLPFVATSAGLVVAWIALLRWREWRASGSLARGLGGAVAIAVVACTAIAVLFEDVFLVRLP